MAKKKGEAPPRKGAGSRQRKNKSAEEKEPCANLTCGALWAATLQNILVTAGVFVAILWFSFVLIGAGQRDLDQREIRSAATILAEGVASRVSLYRQSLVQQAAAVGVIGQLESDDQQGLARSEAWLHEMLPGNPRVSIHPPDVDAIERGSAGGNVGFALLEMLRAALNNQRVPVEVHASEGGAREVMFVEPLVDGDGEVAGLLHAAFPAAFLESMIKGLAGGRNISLRQTTEGGGWELYSTGAAADMKGFVAVPGSIWELGYAAGEGAAAIPTTLAALHGGGLAIIVVMMLINLKRIRVKLASDLTELKSTINEMLGKGGTQTRKLRMRELQGLMEWFVKSAYVIPGEAPVSRGSAKITAKRQPPPASPAKEGRQGAQKPQPNFASQPTEGILVEEVAGEEEAAQPSVELPAGIIGGYDIRGRIGDELGREALFELGRAIGSESMHKHQDTVIIANDGRAGSQELVEALHRGVMGSGCNLVDIGVATTPMLYFATHYLASNSGVMLTGSDTEADVACLKVHINGKVLSQAALEKLRQRVLVGDLMEGEGQMVAQELTADYYERIVDDVQIARPLHVVIDAGNGVAGAIAPALFRQLGCEVTELYCDLDGTFPNHPPDPSDPLNLTPLVNKVREVGADIGFAFDGDGDRLGIVDSSGKIIWPDRVLILLARDVLARQPGADVVYDVKSTRHLATEVLNAGGRPVMWKSGHSLIAEMMKQSDALLGGEFSGHLFFKERWYGFDDAIYAAARLVEVLSLEGRSSAEVFQEVPEDFSTPELVATTPQGVNDKLMQMFSKRAKIPDAKLVTVDGVRAEFEDGWGLVRSSNVTPALKFRFEASTEEALARIQGLFREQVKGVAPDVELPF